MVVFTFTTTEFVSLHTGNEPKMFKYDDRFLKFFIVAFETPKLTQTQLRFTLFKDSSVNHSELAKTHYS